MVLGLNFFQKVPIHNRIIGSEIIRQSSGFFLFFSFFSCLFPFETIVLPF